MSKLKPGVNAADHHWGNSKAIVTLVEFGDYECPHCRDAYPLIKRLLREKSEDLYFVFRNFPLSEIHPHANIAAYAAEAAAKQGKFWEMHQLIFEHQEKLSQPFLKSLAKRLNLDMVQFDSDITDVETQNKVQSDFESGVYSGVNGTPSFYVNGRKVLDYDGTYESLLKVVTAHKIKSS